METPKKDCNCPQNEIGISHKSIVDAGGMLIIVFVVCFALNRIITKYL